MLYRLKNCFRIAGILIPVVGGLLVFFASYFLSQFVFLDAPLTTDENAYIFQANCFADGVLARPVPEPMRMFPHEMLIMDKEVGWLSRYPPAHAAWLVPGVYIQHPRVMVSLAALLSFLLLSRLGVSLGFPTYLFPALVLFSPYFLFMHGTLLSHSSGLLAVSLMFLSYVRWKQTGKIWYAVLAGLGWACFFLNRTYTGALLAIPFGVDALVDLVRYRTRRNLAGTLLFAVFSGLGVVVFQYYNAVTVGDPWTPTYLYYQASDALGFGPRPAGQIPSHHTFSAGIKAMWENLIFLDRWLLGVPGSLVLAVGLGVVGWDRRWSLLCLTSAVIVWLGYVLFWFEGVRTVGPVYYFETLPFLLVLLAFGLRKIYLLLAPAENRRLIYVTFSCLLLGGGSLFFSWQQGHFIRGHQDLGGQYRRLLKLAPENSLILVSKIPGMHYVTRGMAFNQKGLASDPLVAHKGKLHNQVMIGAFPERTPYELVLKGKQLALEPFAETNPVYYRCFASDTFYRTGEDVILPGGIRKRVARSRAHNADWLAYGASFWVSPGSYLLQVDIDVEAVSSDLPLVIDIATNQGRNILAHQRLTELEGNVVEVPFEVTRSIKVEPRIYYNGTGNVAAGKMEIIQLELENRGETLDS